MTSDRRDIGWPCDAAMRRRIRAVDPLHDLVTRARARDATAIAELVRTFLPRVTVLAHQKLQQRRGLRLHGVLQLLSTGDVVQDVLIEVLRGLERWDGLGEEAFIGLLATLVEHRIVDQIRRSQAGRRDARRLDAAGPETAGVAAQERSPATLAMNQEQLQIYRDVLSTFTDRERVLLTLRLEEGVEFASLAVTLAYPSDDAARKAFHAVQARLLLRLRQRGFDPGHV